MHPFLNHMMHVFHQDVFLGISISWNYQTIVFQRNHKLKLILIYKKIRAWLYCRFSLQQCIHIHIYFYHQKSSAKIIKSFKLSPFNTRVLVIFSWLPDRYYKLIINNIYMSRNMCMLVFKKGGKVMLCGVSRMTLRRVSPIVNHDWSKKTG